MPVRGAPSRRSRPTAATWLVRAALLTTLLGGCAAFGAVPQAERATRSPGPVPQPPVVRSVWLAPLGNFPAGEVRSLVDYYASRYQLQVGVVPAMRVPESAVDRAREQLIAEELLAVLRRSDPRVAADPRAVVIGLAQADLYIRGRPDWSWAFGLRGDGSAVISSARMSAGFTNGELAHTRLRKMVTRYIGFLYYDLPPSDDPASVLYESILSVGDLDAIGEDY